MISCIALYDFDIEKFDLKGWVTYGEEWMVQHGHPPNTMGIPPSSKYLRYNNGKKKLEKENYHKEYLHFYGGGEPGTDESWKIAAYFDKDYRITYLCFDEDVEIFSYKILEKLLLDLCQFCSPRYGIGFQRERKYGPDSYALGHSEGLKLAYENAEHGKEDDRICRWLEVYRGKEGYETGTLRDIYPFNVLSQPHLDRIVNGHRFQDWVEHTPERGVLKQVSDTLWTWWIDKEKIPAVREALAPSGMIICL